MANRVPLILNTSLNQIQELPTGDNLDLSNSGIHNAGIITATNFSGDGSQLTGVTAGNANGLTGTPDITVGNIIAQNVSIASTLTYEDVTNIDSVGIITARSSLVAQGDVKFANQSIDNAVNWGKVANILQVRQSTKLTLGNNNDLQLQHNGSDSVISQSAAGTGNLKILSGGAQSIECVQAGAVIIAHNGTSKLSTTTTGASITGGADTVLLVEGTSTASRIDLKTSNHHRFWQTLESDGRFRFYDQTNAKERFTITSAGNVGINSTSPNEVLDVVGNIDIKGGSNSLRITSTAPAVKFTDSDASGGFGMVGVNNTSGSLVLRSDDGNALSNTFMGFEVDGSERLRITSTGGVIFKGGPLQEKVKITAGKLSDNTTIDLENGNVHYFTTQESTTSTPNLRVNASTTLDSVMAVGETIAVTIITTTAAGGYSDQLQIDGSNVTENWVGGSAPTAGGGSGVDIYNYTIIKTAANTYTVIANLTKTS